MLRTRKRSSFKALSKNWHWPHTITRWQLISSPLLKRTFMSLNLSEKHALGTKSELRTGQQMRLVCHVPPQVIHQSFLRFVVARERRGQVVLVTPTRHRRDFSGHPERNAEVIWWQPWGVGSESKLRHVN